MKHSDPAKLFQPFKIRRMERPELDIAIGWAEGEGWNPGLHDADSFYAADPTGFMLGLLENEPIGCISAVRYGNSFGFVGFYLVRPEYRGKGYGIQLWNSAMEYLEGRNAGLDGVVVQQENYKKSGFRLAHRSFRYGGRAGADAAAGTDGIVELSTLPFEEIASYDRELFPEERREFLRRWIVQPESVALAAVRGGRIAGYGIVRPSARGYRIGPLFADDEGIAERLFSALSSRVTPGEPIFLDVPEPNDAAVALALRHGMEPSFETARMYTRGQPALPLHRIFGITSLELG